MPAGSRRTRWLARSRAPVRPCGFLWLFATIAAAAPPVAVPSATVAPTGQGSIINLSLIGSAPAVPAASAAAAPVVPNASGTLSHGNFTLGAGEDYEGSIINLSLIGSAPAAPAVSAAAAPAVPIAFGTPAAAPPATADFLVNGTLAWFAGGTLSHGNFTLGAGEDYDVQVPLSDVPANPVQLWDGKSLTLGAANAGFLVLSASNTHTGTTTVNGGTLAITGWTGNNASGLIGQASGQLGTVIVGATAAGPGAGPGTGGYWRTTGTLFVGYTGTGVLSIAATGTVRNTDGIIGRSNAGRGLVDVAGWWDNTGLLYLGYAGSGTLAIAPSGSVTVGGMYSQNSNTLLRLALSGTRPAFITAGTAQLSGTLAVTGYDGTRTGSKASELIAARQILIRTASGIAGNFSSINITSTSVTGTGGAPDFLTHGAFKSPDGRDYYLGYGLAWHGLTNVSHGNFTLPAGETFEVDLVLGNTTQHPAIGGGIAWDGASLTLTPANRGTLILSASNTYTGDTVVNGGALAIAGWTGSTSQVVIAPAASTGGTVSVTGSLLARNGLTVGAGGAGAFILAGSGFAGFGNNFLFAGRDLGARGRIALADSAILDAPGVLAIGDRGSAELTLDGSARLRTGNVYFGWNATGLGTGTLAGSGSWQVDGNFYVGAFGTGALTLGGAVVISNTGNVYIGGEPTGSGAVSLGGSAFWNIIDSEGFYVGNQGAGALTLAGSGSIRGGGGGVGIDSRATGTALITGSALWDATGSDFYAGRWGRGVLALDGAGRLVSGMASIGDMDKGSGTVTVAGSASWESGGAAFYVGQGGTGALAIRDAGVVRNTSPLAIIGNAATAAGAAALSGSGWWDNAGALLVAYQGSGTLALAGSGSVTAGGYLAIGYAAAGAVSVGDDALLSNTGGLYVGQSGTGALAITGRGRVATTGVIAIGNDSSAAGAITVDGDGLLAGTGNLILGAAGSGSLAIRSAATVTAGGTYSQNDRSTLALDLGGGTRATFLTADSALLSGTLVVLGATGTAAGAKASALSSDSRVLIHTANGITGDFTHKTIAGGSSPVDYLRYDAFARGSDYVLGARLAWFAGTDASHGSFTLPAGSTFEVDVALSDTTAHPAAPGGAAPAWDGKSLLKLGDGTLILSGPGGGLPIGYTGTTAVAAGILQTAAPGILAGSARVVVDGTLDTAAHNLAQQVRDLSGAAAAALVTLGTNSFVLDNTAAGGAYAGLVTGSGFIIKTSPHAQTLSGRVTANQVYAGAGGTLALTGGGAIAQSRAYAADGQGALHADGPGAVLRADGLAVSTTAAAAHGAFAADGAALRLAASSVSTSGSAAHGVFASASASVILTGSAGIATLLAAPEAAAHALYAGGASALIDASAASALALATRGGESRAILAEKGGRVALGALTTLATAGDGAAGLQARSQQAATASRVDVAAGGTLVVSTTGAGADAISAEAVAPGGTAAVTLGACTDVTVHGPAAGLFAAGAGGASIDVPVTGSARILTHGDSALSSAVRAWGGAVNLGDGSVVGTTGSGAHGLDASGLFVLALPAGGTTFTGSISAASALHVSTQGDAAHGAFAAPGGLIDLRRSAAIATAGAGAHGAVITGSGAAILLDATGGITTTGSGAHAIRVEYHEPSASPGEKTFDGTPGNTLPAIRVGGAGAAVLSAAGTDSRLTLGGAQALSPAMIAQAAAAYGAQAEDHATVAFAGAASAGGTRLRALTGGTLLFTGSASAGGSRVTLDDTAVLDLAAAATGTLGIGSLDGGAGALVRLGGATLVAGSGSGTLLESSTYAGRFDGPGGALTLVSHTLTLTGAGAQIGTLANLGGVLVHDHAGAFTVSAAYRIAAAGTSVLSAAAGGTLLSTGGAYVQEGGLAFAVPGTARPSIVAVTATIAGATATLDITNFGTAGVAALDRASGVLASGSHTFLRTTAGIAGDYDPARVTVNGANLAAGLPDYLHGGLFKSGGAAGDLDYNLGYTLAWFAGTAASHGGFTLAAGAAFDVDVPLPDVPAHAATAAGAPAWDGKSLVKLGGGLLVLSASNAHTGTTLASSGTLRFTRIDALGASALHVSASAVAEFSGVTGTLAAPLVSTAASGTAPASAATGTLRITGGADIDHRGDASAWRGLTLIDSGRLLVNNLHGDASAPAPARLQVYAGGTLGGSGTIGGRVAIAPGGRLAPGNSPGMLTIDGDLALDGALLSFDLGKVTNPGHVYPADTNDQLHVLGDLTLAGTGTLDLLTAAAAGLAKGEYDLIHYEGALAGSASNLKIGTVDNQAPAGADASKYVISTSETNYVKLLYDLGYFSRWDGGDPANWQNAAIDGGSGTWFAPGARPAYASWSGSDGVTNGEWLDAGFAIFGGASGTVTVDSSGTAAVAFSGAQFRTGGYLITGGTLTTADPPAVSGTAGGGGGVPVILNTDALVTATINTVITGTHGLEKAGAGALVLGGSNTYAGPTAVTGGTLVMAGAGALGGGGSTGGSGTGASGAGAPGGGVTIAAGAALRVATGSVAFEHALGGAGLFHVALADASDTFRFTGAAAAGSGTAGSGTGAGGPAFTGTALFNDSAFTLDTDTLAAATVRLAAGNTTLVAAGTAAAGSGTGGTGGSGTAAAVVTATHRLGNLAIDGATLVFHHDTTAGAGTGTSTGTAGFRPASAAGIIATGTLDAASGTITVIATAGGTAGGAGARGPTGLLAKPLLQQDEPALVRLIEAASVTGGNLTLAGGAAAPAAIENAAAVATATATYAQTLDYAGGLSIGYELTRLDLLAGLTTTLDSDTAAPPGGDELHAQITGSGNLAIAAAGSITLNKENTYTGTTTVATGTLIAGADHALGSTINLSLIGSASAAPAAAFDLAGHFQTVGSLDTAAGSTLSLGSGTLAGSGTSTGSGTLAVTAGGTLAGALVGAPGGVLALGGLADITGANPAFAAAAVVTGTTVLHHAQALGDTGTLALVAAASGGSPAPAGTAGTARLDAVTGTFAKTITGSGVFALANSSSVALAGANTAFTGTFDIAPGNTLKAAAAGHLGSAAAAVAAGGTLALGAPPAAPADWTPAPGARITGAGALVKEDANTVTLARANTGFTGTTLVSGGTLRLENLLATGTAAVVNNAALVLAPAAATGTAGPGPGVTGAYVNPLSGTGATTVAAGASVAVGGSNTAFAGEWDVIGDMLVAEPENLGPAPVTVAAGGTLRLQSNTIPAWAYANALSGAGEVAVNLSGGTLGFTASALTGTAAGGAGAFTGTVRLAATTMHLGTNAAHAANAPVLARATLQLDAGSTLHAGPGSGAPAAGGTAPDAGKLGGLTFNGGSLRLPMDGVAPAEVLRTGTLSITGSGLAASTVVFENYTGGTIAATPAAAARKNWLDQDDLTENATLLVAAGTLAEPVPRQIAIHKADGTPLTGGQVVSHDEVNAIYNYTAQTSATAAGAAARTGATPAAGAGLYYDYVLAELNVKPGKTLALDTANAADNTLSAAITGAGAVTYATGSTLLLTGSNTYTGSSTILSGTVIAGADHALGSTFNLSLIGPASAATPAAFDLAGRAQTVGSLDIAPGATLNLHSGSLAIQDGGQIAGALAGAGALALAGGTLAVTGSNGALAATVAIAPAAAARLSHASGLGDTGAAIVDGRLVLDTRPGAIETLGLSLSGSGHFEKLNTGTLVLAAPAPGPAPAFAGSATLAAGRLVATRLDSLGTAAIAVAAGAVFEQKNVTGTLQNALSGDGGHHLAGGALTLADAARYTIANTVLDPAASLVLAAAGIRLGALQMNHGTLAFAPANRAGAAAIATLGDTPGNFLMNVDLSALRPGLNPAGSGAANHLAIAAAGSGTHTVRLETAGSRLAETDVTLELIRTGTAAPPGAAPSGATFALAGGAYETGLTTLELLPGDRTAAMPDPAAWYLADTGLSHTADALLNTAGVLALDWAYSLDSLHQRMGDLRAENLPANLAIPCSSSNIWMRGRGYRLNATNRVSGLAFEQHAWGVTAGLDHAWATETGVNLLGAFIDMGGVNRRFDNHGTGETRGTGFGIYLTRLGAGGWFADAIARLDHYDNEFEARAVDGSATRGEYINRGLGLSLEIGRRLRGSNGWWFEPGMQVALLRLDGVDYTTREPASGRRPISVHVEDAEIYQYRALVRFGRQWKDSKWHPYGKFAAVAVDSGGGEVSALKKTLAPDYDGKRVEFGVGTSYRINDRTQLYIDYEYARAQAYERPWSLNLGCRHLW